MLTQDARSTLGGPGPRVIPRFLVPLRRPNYRIFMLLLPAVFFSSVVMVYPLVSSVYQSLHSAKSGAFIGLANYWRFFSDPLAGSITLHTFMRAGLGVAPSYVVGLLAALALNQRVNFMRVFTTVVLLPFVISPPIALNMWKIILDSQTGILASFGVHSGDVLTNSHLIWPILTYINTWGSFQLYTMILLAALKRIPSELYEAAAMDGAGTWQRFRAITFPAIAHVSILVCVVHFIASFQEFNLIYILTGGGPLNETQTLATYAYQTAFTNNEMNYATTLTSISTIMLAITLGAVAGFGFWIRRKWSGVWWNSLLSRLTSFSRRRLSNSARISTGRALRQSSKGRRSWQKGRFRYIWVGLLALYAVGPILYLLSASLDSSPAGALPISLWPRHFSFDNYIAVLSNPDLWSNRNIALPPLALNFFNSIVVTTCTTLVVVFCGALAGYSISHSRPRPARALVVFFIILMLVPVIVLVFPLYGLLASVGLLGTQVGLIFATTVISLPMSVLFFNVFFRDLPPEVEEAAAIDGAGFFRTFWSVSIPMSRTAFGAVASFALINTWNEFLLASTLVANSRLRTLPPALNQYMSSYSFAASSTPGMQAVYLLIPIAAAVMVLTFTQRQLTSAYEGGAVKG